MHLTSGRLETAGTLRVTISYTLMPIMNLENFDDFIRYYESIRE